MTPMPVAVASHVKALSAIARSHSVTQIAHATTSNPNSATRTRISPGRPRSSPAISAGMTRYGVTVAW